jgi:SAM-dependent methyltransferase
LQDQRNIRAKSYRYLERRVLPWLERETGRPLRIADLGAGNCWLSYRLALRGHHPIAIDIHCDSLDGLGAGGHYQKQTAFARLNAEFDDLPLADGSVDVAIFNASIHYSTEYRRTLAEIRRCLRPGGCFLIVDSPVYQRREHGEMMRSERHQQFQSQYGFASDTLDCIEYLDLEMLDGLSRGMGIAWSVYRPWYGWRWALRPWKARWRSQRPPSNFWILAGRFSQ